MREMTYQELLEIAKEEKVLSLKDASVVLKNLMKNSDENYEEYIYAQSPRKK